MTYREFVEERLACVSEEDGPFCPFSTPNCMGYCDAAMSGRCYGCEESLGEYTARYCDRI